ncbi:hypothetical protein JCM8115_004483 [Rhodotorula mucilaginosa]
MPSRRLSVDPDAVDQSAEPPRSPPGARPASSRNNGDAGSSTTGRTSRGGSSSATRGTGRGRGRGRGKARASATARESATSGSGSHAVGTASETGSSSDNDDEDAARASRDDVLARSTRRPPRPVSPELGIPALLAAVAQEQPRSSSLSALSSRASSPALENSSLAQPVPNGAPVEHRGSSSPSSGSTARPASPRPRDQEHNGPDPAPSTPSRKITSDRNPLDSLSELDSSDDEEQPLASRSQTNDPASAGRSVSTESTPAPAGTNNFASLSPGPKRRGRPPGSKTRHSTGSAPPKSRRSANDARPGSLASPNRVSSSESVTPAPASAPARATRANVTLPPGYIWGVTSSRWPRKSKKGEEAEELPEEDEGSQVEVPDGEPVKESNLSDLDNTETEIKPMEVETEEAKPTPPPAAPPPEESPRAETPKDDVLDLQAASILRAMDPEPTPMPSTSREPSHDGSVDSVPVTATPKGKGKGKGKRGKKVLPEPIERTKRRRLDGLDKETAERLAAREAARAQFLSDLEAEMQLVEQHTHPLLDLTYRRLQEEKKQKLAQLRRYQEEREQQLARSLEAANRANWDNWSDRKDRLRMDLYLKNHSSLKSLLDEEKVFPFFRDHPLFVNHHDLPPTGWYRGPQRDPAFAPRSLVHAGHYVEPPPVNPALAHDSWRLAPDEIEADLALFYDIDEVQVQPPPPPPPPPVPVAPIPYYGMYGNQSAPYYYGPGGPAAPFAEGPAPPPGPRYPAPGPSAPFAGPSFGTPMPPGHIGPAVGTGGGAGAALAAPSVPSPSQNGLNGPPPPTGTLTQKSNFSHSAAGNAQQPPAPAPRPRSRTPQQPVKFEHQAPIRQSAPVTQANGPAAAPTPTPPTQARSVAASRPRSPPRIPAPAPASAVAKSPRTIPPSSGSAGISSAPVATPLHGAFSSFASRQPQAPSSVSRPQNQQPKPQSQPARAQPALAAPVWPAYTPDAGPSRPPNPPAARPQPYFPAVTSTQTSSYPPAAARVPAPPVMPGPPGGLSGNKPWPSSSSSHSPNTPSSLPPIHQTLFPTAFPTGGLPPMSKPLPPQQPTAPSATTDRSPAPLRSPQQPQTRPSFPSMQTQKPQSAHDPLPLPSWLRPNGRDSTGAPGSTTLPGPKLPHELRAAAAAAAAASSVSASAANFPGVGNGAGLPKSPWS